MIPEIGLFALILALCFAMVWVIVASSGIVLKRSLWFSYSRALISIQTALLGLSLLCLIYALLTNDFSVTYVAQNSNTQLPWGYKIAALWGAHEGSLLLWASLLSFWTWLVTRHSLAIPMEILARIVIILSVINSGFLWFILATSNPFARSFDPLPVQGADLNPLLQDPGLVLHPPILYMGYVGFAVIFAFACAALWCNDDRAAEWAKWMRPWCLAAWSFLTLGITLGSWWAYRVLGWGGWWFWDPVENASLLPWLIGTALLHTLLVAQKRQLFFNWIIFLSLCGFSLSLLGTFLVRSGVLISVHAFASDPNRGIFLLKYLSLVIGSALLLFTLRAPKRIQGPPFDFLSREALIFLNNLILFVIMCTILLGTLYPLLLDAIKGVKLSVGPPYFNTLIVPMLWLLLLLMGIGIHSSWSQTAGSSLGKRLWPSALLSLGLGLIISYGLKIFSLSFTLSLVLALWVIITTLQKVYFAQRRMNLLGMALAHIGIAITAIGISVTTSFSVQRDIAMTIGEELKVDQYHLSFSSVQALQGTNYTGVKGNFIITALDNSKILLAPQRRIYSASKMAISQAAVAIEFWRDFYLALGEPLPDGAWSIRFYVKPMVRWIWLGGILVLLGGIASLWKANVKMKLKT